MTYRERRRARADRLRGWSDKRVEDATAALNSYPDIRHDYAFITQPGHIPFRARMNASDDRAHASLVKARGMAARADSIDAAADVAIYSDDVDAVERLTAKIADLVADRDAVVAFNRAVRKSGVTADLLAGLSDARRADLLSLARIGMARPDGTFPAYVTSNLSGNISRLRARLDGLKGA